MASLRGCALLQLNSYDLTTHLDEKDTNIAVQANRDALYFPTGSSTPRHLRISSR